MPGPASRAAALCRRCRKRPPAFEVCRAWGAYSGPLRRLIRRYKYAGYRRLVAPLTDLLRSAYHSRDLPVPDFVVPVPSHKKRLQERGFDPVGTLARRFSRQERLSFLKAVERTRHTRPQFGLDVEDRRRNLRAAFRSRDIPDLKGARVLLIDDILTTGTTASELAKTLKDQAKVDAVSVLVVARTIRYFG